MFSGLSCALQKASSQLGKVGQDFKTGKWKKIGIGLEVTQWGHHLVYASSWALSPALSTKMLKVKWIFECRGYGCICMFMNAYVFSHPKCVCVCVCVCDMYVWYVCVHLCVVCMCCVCMCVCVVCVHVHVCVYTLPWQRRLRIQCPVLWNEGPGSREQDALTSTFLSRCIRPPVGA